MALAWFQGFKALLNSRLFFWLLLALPCFGLINLFMAGKYHRLLHPTGEFSARFLILSLMLTPLVMLMPKVTFWRWLLKRRRYIGVEAFGYGALHTYAYIIDEGSLDRIIAELANLSLWTGWLAFFIFIALTLISNDMSVRRLGLLWKKIQRFAYGAALLTLIHWFYEARGLAGLLVHFTPLALLEIYRIGRHKGWWHFRFA